MKKFFPLKICLFVSLFILSLAFIKPADAGQLNNIKDIISKVNLSLTGMSWQKEKISSVEDKDKYSNPDLTSPPQISLSHSLKAFFALKTPSVKEFIEKEKSDYYRALFGLNIAF